MNTTTQAKRILAVGRFVDNEWIVATGELDALHPDDIGAYELGQAHALTGHPRRAGMYERLVYQHEYLIGYRDGLDTLEMVDEREDRDFWTRGQW